MSHALLRRSFSTVLSLAALAGCSDDPATPGRSDCPAAGVALTVGPGSAPALAWTPRCQVSALRVETAAGDTVYWEVGRDDERLDAPLQYGIVPAGAAQRAPARPLAGGRAYRAVLIQQVGIGRVLATQPFTP